MCGIVGIYAFEADIRGVNQKIYDALTIIQHRGQDAAGIMTSNGRQVLLRKANGLVRDVFRAEHMLKLQGNLGIGHVRYPTAGSTAASESQPFYVNSPYGLGLVHNGNLINTEELADDLMTSDLRHLNTHSDSEILLNVFAHELQQVGGIDLTPKALFKAVSSVYKRVSGAFSALVMINGYGLLAFRDSHGIRPLVYGKRETDKGIEYMFASESIALDALGFELVDDVKPGEAIYIDQNHQLHQSQCSKTSELNPCLFEYIYLARPDSIMDNISIHQARVKMGEKLADRITAVGLDKDIDVVIPIPDTSRTSALALAEKIKVPFSEGFVKNRYIGRTFIMPGQQARKASVRLKLNAIKEEFRDKNVLLVDDSIVRGTTSKEIIQMARDAGAKNVFFASAAPEVRFPNVYGIDMPAADELVAHNRSLEEIKKEIGADKLIYQSLEDVCAAINAVSKKPIKRFEDSIFTKQYITGGIDDAYLNSLADARNDQVKQANALMSNDDKHRLNENNIEEL